MLEIDTTNSPSDYQKDFQKIYSKNKFYLRKKYSLFIDNISHKFSNNIDWWVSSVAERNLNSSLYHNICLYFSLKEFLKKKKVDKIIVNNFELLQKIKKFYKKKIILKKSTNYSYFIKTIIKHLIIFFYIKIFKKRIKIKKKISLVDKFITSTKLNHDRYYNNYFDKKDYIYVPTFVNLSNLNIVKCINKMSEQKYLLTYSYLSFADFLFSIKYYFRIKKLNLGKCYLKNVEFSSLVTSELNNLKNINAIYLGIQNYLFAKKLKQNNVKIEKIINWFENSNVDKGWNMGFQKFYSKSKILGYQGYFIEKEWLYLDPSNSEYKYKVIPKEIVCIGSNLVKSRKEHCKNLKIVNGLNLRFKNMEKIKKTRKNKNSILVTLNIDIESSRRIIQSILKTEYCKSGKSIYIKEHPLLKIQKLNIFPLPKNIKLYEGNYLDIVKKFKVIITSGSSSSIMQAIFLNCYVIFPFNNYFDKFNFKELKIPNSKYKVCKTTKELDKYINYYLKKKVSKHEVNQTKIIMRKNLNNKIINNLSNL